MAEGEVQQRLAAVLAADVVGYSRLMGEDERATIATLREFRDVFQERIEACGGRVVDMAGDSVLAIFNSANGAVQAATESQGEIAKRNEGLPENRRMLFRVGVNLGDIQEAEDGTIYGDGVNVAARLEAMANPGGINVSGSVFDSVRSKAGVQFNFLGEHEVKNIADPVRAYGAVIAGQTASAKVVGRRRLGAGTIVAAVVLVALFAGGVVWQALDPMETESVDQDPVFEIPTGPSVAVLPFDNMSDDQEQEYFSDGLTEDIITELARYPQIWVPARNTTFQYKGQAVDVQEVGRKLGVAYVLEGGVRRSGEQVRITAQLINVADGNRLWAERYDRELTDIFAVQDEITGRIVAALAADYGVLERVGQKRASEKDPNQLEAYDLMLQARGLYNVWRPDAYAQSKALLESAIELDPDNEQAHVELAWWTMIGWVARFEQSELPPAEIKTAAIRAAELAPSDGHARMVAAFGYFFDKQLDLFEREVERSFELSPNSPRNVAALGALLVFSGQIDRGETLVKKAFDYNPIAAAGWYHSAMFYVHYFRAEYQASIDILRQHPLQHLCENSLKYVAAYGRLGDPEKAQEYWQKCVESEGGWSTSQTRDFWDVWNFREHDLDDLMVGVKMGLGQDPDAPLTN